mmetsp:Transcript_79827/g.247656  ORF Transcript_79827/g.247656 Transcript_79827/m.247656 type:complete len:140 (-) Transcript_79827:31-450(-)
MIQQSYEEQAFRQYGLEVANIQITDTQGGLPKPKDVARMIDACDCFLDSSLERPAVFVHCKGGFGRSVVLACCLVIYHLDVPGAALLGWVRIARPGTVTTPKQEVFLKSLKGCQDVKRYAQLEPASGCAASCARFFLSL